MREELIRRYYNKRAEDEWQRLERHRMEFSLSSRLLEERLPTGGRILDCGGGSGRYSLWLAERGYQVTLFDLSSSCLDRAKVEASNRNLELIYECGSATDLSRFPNDTFDAVLLMGPLYHLMELRERQQSVAEAARVLRRPGLLAAAFITRTAALRFVAKQWSERILDLYEPMLHLSEQGFSEAFPPADDDHFHAYFSHPTEVEPLLKAGGLKPTGTFAVEGFVSMIDDQLNTLEGPQWSAWVDLNLKWAGDPSLFSGAEHLLSFAVKE
jgi:2-polyprenyl-3-methyl-5-hydroxy-6-metoxy-1,4-benzoquinol methylase